MRDLLFRTAEYPFFDDYPAYVEMLVRTLRELCAAMPAGAVLSGIGIGAPNANYHTGRIERPVNLWKFRSGEPNPEEGRRFFSLCKEVGNSFPGIPVRITNDANAAALGEIAYGNAGGMRDFIMVTLGTGLGSGFVAGGRMIYGHDADAAALMEMIRQKEYSLLLTDLNMPDINGFELLELLRSSNVGNSPTIPVVVATASGSCNKGELLAKGFAGCLFKPFSISELMEVSDRCAIKATPDGKPDFSALLSYGNEAVMLEKLITETEKEMQAVRDAAKEKDLQKLDSLIHHLRSSWEVLRADQPLNVLYGLLRGDALPDGEALSHAVTAVLDKGVEIIRLAEEERRKYDVVFHHNYFCLIHLRIFSFPLLPTVLFPLPYPARQSRHGLTLHHPGEHRHEAIRKVHSAVGRHGAPPTNCAGGGSGNP